MIVQVPAATNVSSPPDVMVQTDVVDEVKVTLRPVASVVAVSVGVVPKFFAPGLAKVMVWIAAGVTAFDAAEAGP